MNKINILTKLTILTLSPVLVFAQSPAWINTAIIGSMRILNGFTLLLVSIALLYFIWGLVKFIANSGDEKAVEQGKQMMVWGVVGLFVIVSVWGFVAVLQQLVGTGDVYMQPPPQTLAPAPGP